VAAVNFAGALRTTVGGGSSLTVTDWTGITVAPQWSTVSGSTINFGAVRGIRCRNPVQALFGASSAGTETLTSYYGLDMEDITIGGTAPVAAVRSEIITGTGQNFLLNVGGADSDFGGGDLLDVGTIEVATDNIGVALGALGGSGDVNLNWNGTAFEWDFASGDDIRLSAGGSNDHTLQSANFGSGSQFLLGYDQFAFGQTSIVGNQVGIFVAPTRSTGVAGEWSDFLLTQSGNITIDHAMGGVYGWTVNAPSMTIGSGSVTTAAALNIGGNVNQGTNRYGLRVLSSPSGGTLNYCARFEGSAGVRVDGLFEHQGATLAFYGATAVTQPGDIGLLTDSTGGTANTTVAAVSGTGDDATINDNFADKESVGIYELKEVKKVSKILKLI